MSDPKATMTPDQVREAALTDWRLLSPHLTARFRTKDFAAGLALVDAIGELAEAADHHPDLQLTYTAVVVSLISHDVDGITSRDIDLARQISERAAELGARPDPSSVAVVELCLDTSHEGAVSPFYAALLGGKPDEGELTDPTGQVPTLWWQDPTEDRGGAELPPTEVPQRWHLDVWVGEDEGPRRVQSVLDAGGRLVSDERAPAFWVVEDADGNRSCICTTSTR